MPRTPVPFEQLRDPVGKRYWPDQDRGRDGSRTPMQWEPGDGAGFTSPGVVPWLPLGDNRTRNVTNQRDDPGSVLTLCRDLIALRRREPDLKAGAYASLPTPSPGVWAWRRGEGIVVAVNLSDDEGVVEDVRGTVEVGTRRERDGERVHGSLALAPWEGVVVSV